MKRIRQQRRGFHDQRHLPGHRRRHAAQVPRRQGRVARSHHDRAGADDAARIGEGRRRGQPDRRRGDAGALRDRRPARAHARRSGSGADKAKALVSAVGKDLDEARLRSAAGGRVRTVHDQGDAADDEHRRVERARPRPADLPRGCADGGVRAGQHRARRARASTSPASATTAPCGSARSRAATMLPDPGFFADCMRAAFSELVAAANALPEGKGGTRAAAVRTSARAPVKSSRGKGAPAGERSKRGRAGKAAAATPSGKKLAATAQRTKRATRASGNPSVRP